MSDIGWWADGLLFENCSCQLVCPAHISFKQNCTHDRCRGHWAIHFDAGRLDEVVLDGLNAVVVFDTPQRMYSGGWTEGVYIDARATVPQRAAIEAILKGEAGGPWQVLARFVERWLPTRFVDITFVDEGRHKHMSIPGVFETDVEAIRAKDDQGEVQLSNLFNQIHGDTHVLGRGRTTCTDPPLDFSLEKTHGLYSRFAWRA